MGLTQLNNWLGHEKVDNEAHVGLRGRAGIKQVLYKWPCRTRCRRTVSSSIPLIQRERRLEAIVFRHNEKSPTLSLPARPWDPNLFIVLHLLVLLLFHLLQISRSSSSSLSALHPAFLHTSCFSTLSVICLTCHPFPRIPWSYITFMFLFIFYPYSFSPLAPISNAQLFVCFALYLLCLHR